MQQFGIQSQTLRLNHHGTDSFLTDLDPYIVVFDRFITEEQFGWRVTEFAPNAIKILDTEDLHSLRASRKLALDQDKPFTTRSWIQHELTKREVASIYRCDLSLIISEFEMELLERKLKIPSSLLLYLPFLLEPLDRSACEALDTFEEREHFIFLGTGKHPPNIDAIKWLKNEIWPLIRKELPEVQLHIYGAYLPRHILEMEHPPGGFLVKGRVDDAEGVMAAAKVNLVPLRYGAGLKGKLIMGLSLGTPGVATKIAAEGLHGYPLKIAKSINSAADFAAQAVNIYKNEAVWGNLQKEGFEIINNQFNKDGFYRKFGKRLKMLQKNLEEHRNENFTGAMLLHHTMAGSKYMAKWIALKNSRDIN